MNLTAKEMLKKVGTRVRIVNADRYNGQVGKVKRAQPFVCGYVVKLDDRKDTVFVSESHLEKE